MLRHQCRDSPLGIDGEVVGAALFTSGQIQALDKVRGTGLHQSDAHRHGTGTRGKIERQFGHDRFPCVREKSQWTSRPPARAIILLSLDRGAKGEGNLIKKGCKAFGINGFLNGR